MMEILEKDIACISSISKKVRSSFKKFERFTIFLESEVTRIKAKDIKSVAADINLIQKLFIESKSLQNELEQNAVRGDLFKIFNTGEKIKTLLQKIKSLEYLTDIRPETFYKQYRAVFETSGETMLPDDLDQEMKDLFNKLVTRSLIDVHK